MNTEKLKVESIVSADIRVSNSNNTSRVYNISAVVHMGNGIAHSVQSGIVETLDAEDGSRQVIANFDSWSEDSLNVQFQNKNNRGAVFSAVEDFVSKCRTEDGIDMTESLQ